MNVEMNKHVWNSDQVYKDREGENPGEMAFCTNSHKTLC